MRSAKQPNLQENPVNSLKTYISPSTPSCRATALPSSKPCRTTASTAASPSPPYYALRDYGVEGQIGREATPEAYIRRLVEVFREVYRVLRKDGTFWLNISDTYCKHRPSGCKGQGHAGHPLAAGAGAP